MVDFTDTNGQIITDINKSNVEAFSDWLLSLPPKENVGRVYSFEDSCVLDVAANFNRLNDNAKYVFYQAAKNGSSRCLDSIITDMSPKSPEAFAWLVDRSGNETFSGATIFSRCVKDYENSDPDEVLDNLVAQLKYSKTPWYIGYSVPDKNKGVPLNLSSSEKNNLKTILDISLGENFLARLNNEQNNEYIQRKEASQYAAQQIMENLIKASCLDNCELGGFSGKTLREKVDASILAERGNAFKSRLKNMKPKFYSEPLVAAVVERGCFSEFYKDIPLEKITQNVVAAAFKSSHYRRVLTLADALKEKKKKGEKITAQEEKNAKLIDPSYLKLRDALVRLADKREIHDRNNHGEEKTLNQRYQELCCEIFSVKEFKDIPESYVPGLLQDTFEHTAKIDVLQGRGEKLGERALHAVFVKKENASLIEKLPDETRVIAGRYSYELGLQQRKYQEKGNKEQNNDIRVYAASLSLQKRKKFLQEKAAELENDRAKYENGKKALTDVQTLEKRYDEQIKILDNKITSAKAVEELNRAYVNIQGCFKDGKPNKHETDLIASVVEEKLGERYFQLSVPEQGSLPLFGRKAEAERRDNLERAIKTFNQGLKNIQPDGIDIKPYLGQVLSSDVFNRTRNDIFNAEKTKQDLRSDCKNKKNEILYSAGYPSARYIAEYEERDLLIKQELKKIKEKENKHREIFDEVIGHSGKSELKPVTKDMDKGTKMKVRAENKQIQDKLLAKQKQQRH